MPWVKTRIAPTPSGPVHLGNAYNFILTWWWARSRQGQLFLRIDDADFGRTRQNHLEDIFESLEWLEIDTDQGPESASDFAQNFSQRKKRDYYFEQLESFPTFVCECSRSLIKRLSPSGAYPGICHSKNLVWRPGRAIRWRGEEHNTLVCDTLKDVILWRKDDMPAYQLTSVIDDRDLNIDLIVRGEDLRPSGKIQALLARALGWPFPEGANLIYHPLLKDSQGRKLSKSSPSSNTNSLKTWRKNGQNFTNLIDLWAKEWGLPKGKIEKLSQLLDYAPPSFS